MIEVKVKETRVVSLCMDKSNYLNDVGNTEENNATMLHFSFPNSLLGVDIKEYDKKVYFKSGEHVSNAAIDENMCIKLSAEQTIYPVLTFQVLCEAKGITWMTFPKTLTLAESIVKKSINSDGKINKITVSERRGLFPQYSNLGTIGEKNATTLLFLLPETLRGYSENIVCETAQGSFNYEISNDTFDLPSEVLTGSTLDLQLILRDGDKVIWKSIPYTFTLNPTLNDSGINVIDTAKAEQRETDRTELAGVVSELTGEDYSTSDWDGLMYVTAELPVKTAQDIIDLRDCTDLKYAFERCTTLPSILVDTYNLETDSETAEKKYIRLPYLNTKNMVFNIWSPKPSAFQISKSIVECGFDVSSCKTISATQNSPFVFANYLQRTKLTGIRSLDRMWYMFYNAVGLIEIELGDSGTAPETLNSLYWQGAFSGCTSLQAITGDPLDMSRGNYYSNADDKAETRTFYNCKDLRHVRFKAGTICHDLDLSYCPALIKKYEATTDDPGTLLSIINGIRDYTGAEDPITIKFSTFVKSYLSSWRCTIDEQTGLYVYSDKNSDNTMWTILTTTKGVVIS